MQINIKAQNTTLTPAITDYIHKRFGSLTKYFQDKESEAMLSVQVGKTTNHHHAGDDLFATEVNLDVGSTHLHGEAFHADLYASIDRVKDDLARELTSGKKKKLHLLRRGGQRIKNIMKGFYDR